MIHTIRTVAVGDQESKIDSPIILYRGDREVEVEFTINGSKFTFTNGGNVIKSTNATHGQLVINTPTGENMFSEVTECRDGKVVFVITKEMIDELIEVGFYSFQIRLFDESQISRVTIPPVLKGIDIRNPIAAEDETNLVDIALVDYAVAVKDEFEDLSTFLPDGNYNKTEWESKDVISGAKLNKIEDALYNINSNMEAADLALLNRVEFNNRNIIGQFQTLSSDVTDDIEGIKRDLNNDIVRFKNDIEIEMQQEFTEFEHILYNNDNPIILYTFFRNNKDISVDFYISNDGRTIKRINNKSTNILMRDPSIIYKNNRWFIAGTSYNPHDFAVFTSDNLVDWTTHYISVGLYNNTGEKVWAPEWFDDGDNIYILISKSDGSTTIDIHGDEIPYFEPYMIRCSDTDTLTFDQPIKLNLEDKNKIDPCIIKANGVYNMFIKDEYDKFTEHWTSPDLVTWTYLKDVVELGQFVEGPSIINVDGMYYLYADSYISDSGLTYFVTSYDLKKWSERRVLKTDLNRVRHGSPMVVESEKARMDLSKFITANIPQENKMTYEKICMLSSLADSNGLIDNLELIEGCVYNITGNNQVKINNVSNKNGARFFYFMVNSASTASITLLKNDVISVPVGYTYSAYYGDNDRLIPFIYVDGIDKFKPIGVNLDYSLGSRKTVMNRCSDYIQLETGTYDNLEIIDGRLYKVDGASDVIINNVSGDTFDGAHFYLLLASSGTGSITINSGSNIIVQGGSFVIDGMNSRHEIIFEFIKLPSSVFRLKQ